MLTLPPSPQDCPDAARLFAASEDAAPPGLHFLAVPGLRMLLTPGMLAAREALVTARAQRRFVCVLGDAGVGNDVVRGS